jgi:hypothetical protein
MDRCAAHGVVVPVGTICPECIKVVGGSIVSHETKEAVVDNWRHRCDGMRCMTCMWFVEKAVKTEVQHTRVGRCRRHAPTMSGWPVMFASDWCGDHKLDETKAVSTTA